MRVTIIADASFCPDHKVAGYGFWIASERGKQGGGGPMKSSVATNVTAEMMALCNALHEAVRLGLVRASDVVLLQTDCMAAIDAFTGQRMRLIEQESQAVQHLHGLRDKLFLEVQFRHVKGHTGNTEARFVTNKMCDRRAKAAMRRARAVKICQELKELLK